MMLIEDSHDKVEPQNKIKTPGVARPTVGTECPTLLS